MAGAHSRNDWMVWLTFAIGLLLSVSPLPQFMEILRPLWLALLLAFWVLALPQKIGMVPLGAWGSQKTCCTARCWGRTR